MTEPLCITHGREAWNIPLRHRIPHAVGIHSGCEGGHLPRTGSGLSWAGQDAEGLAPPTSPAIRLDGFEA